jgi:outer membrane protein assembly factor BamB
VYIGTSCGALYAVDADSGAIKWTYGRRGGPNPSGFTVYDGIGYLLTTDVKLHGLNLETGNEVGYAAFSPDQLPLGRNVDASYVAVADSVLLMNPGNRQVFVFAAKSK